MTFLGKITPKRRFSPFRDTAESERKRKRTPEDKSKRGEEEKRLDGRRKKEDNKGRELEGKKDPDAKRRRQTKEESSSDSEDQEVGVPQPDRGSVPNGTLIPLWYTTIDQGP